MFYYFLNVLKNILIEYRHTTQLKRKYNTSIIYQGVRVDKNSKLEGFNVLFSNVILMNSNLGMHTYIQQDSEINNADIGKFCSIGKRVSIGLPAHDLTSVSTHPSFYLLNTPLATTFVKEDFFQSFKQTMIAHDVWIGQGAMILGGVKIGLGAVIGAGAVVTHDVPEYAVVAGVPARVIKFRFDMEAIEKLKMSEWWNMPESWLRENANIFRSPSSFFDAYEAILRKEKDHLTDHEMTL